MEWDFRNKGKDLERARKQGLIKGDINQPKLTTYEEECLGVYYCINTLNRGNGIRLSDISEYCKIYGIDNLSEIDALIYVLMNIDSVVMEQKQKLQQKEVDKLNRQNKNNKSRR